MSDFWTNYWKQGHLNSFGDATNKNYQGVIGSSWKQFFKRLSTNGSKVVDIGTGNGALIEIALSQAEDATCEFIGVDYATLNIHPELELPNVRFLERTNAESLPIETNSVNAVVSQFGVEYTNFHKSIAECSRILKSGGTLKFVIHHTESSIVKPNKDILMALRFLKMADGPLSVLEGLLLAVEKFGQRSEQAERYRKKLNGLLTEAQEKYQAGIFGTNFPAFLRAVMNPSVTFSNKQSMLTMFKKEMIGQFERLDDLISAAKTDEEIAELLCILETNGINAESDTVIENGQLLGLSIEGIKR